MTGKKYRKILTELFENQKDMAAKLGVSQAKVSDAITGKSGLSTTAVGILLTDYNLDPVWFFNGLDEEPIKFRDSTPKDSELKQKYYDALEENVSLLREKAEWYKERDAKKNHQNLPDEQ